MRGNANEPRRDGPIAGQFASSNKPPLTSINGALMVGNDGAHTGTTAPKSRAKRRMNAPDVEELASRLSERDIAILGSIAEHQFLTAHQVEVLHFADLPAAGNRIARRTLARLRDHRLLGTLKRRIGGVRADSGGLVHYVDDVGNQLLHGRRVRRVFDPSPRFVGHRLAVADAHLALIEADRQRQFELVHSAVEPKSWRRFTGIGGARLILKPDLYAETAVPPGSDFVRAWFIEIDLGTEHVQTLLKKCRDYEAYRRTGIEQTDGGSFPVVIWSVTHAEEEKAVRRRTALQQAIASDRTLPSALFRVIAPDQLVPLLQQGGAS